MATRIHVDFNDIESNDRLTALVEHADGPINVGHLAVLYDADKNHCQALVIDISDEGLVSLSPDWTTWNKTMLDALTELTERARDRRVGWPFEAPTGLDPEHQPERQLQLTAS